jgi:hypothetical protein
MSVEIVLPRLKLQPDFSKFQLCQMGDNSAHSTQSKSMSMKDYLIFRVIVDNQLFNKTMKSNSFVAAWN